MGVIWWGTWGGGTRPPTFGSGGTEYLIPPPPPPPPHTHVLGWKKITYLRFTVIVTGFIRTTCSHSLGLPIFRYSEYIQYTQDERKHKSEPHWPSFFKINIGGDAPTPPLSVASCLRRLQLIAPNIFITQFPPHPPPHIFSLQMTPMLADTRNHLPSPLGRVDRTTHCMSSSWSYILVQDHHSSHDTQHFY